MCNKQTHTTKQSACHFGIKSRPPKYNQAMFTSEHIASCAFVGMRLFFDCGSDFFNDFESQRQGHHNTFKQYLIYYAMKSMPPTKDQPKFKSRSHLASDPVGIPLFSDRGVYGVWQNLLRMRIQPKHRFVQLLNQCEILFLG